MGFYYVNFTHRLLLLIYKLVCHVFWYKNFSSLPIFFCLFWRLKGILFKGSISGALLLQTVLVYLPWVQYRWKVTILRAKFLFHVFQEIQWFNNIIIQNILSNYCAFPWLIHLDWVYSLLIFWKIHQRRVDLD